MPLLWILSSWYKMMRQDKMRRTDLRFVFFFAIFQNMGYMGFLGDLSSGLNQRKG